MKDNHRTIFMDSPITAASMFTTTLLKEKPGGTCCTVTHLLLCLTGFKDNFRPPMLYGVVVYAV